MKNIKEKISYLDFLSEEDLQCDENFSELFEADKADDKKIEGTVVEGRVVFINKKRGLVVVDVGLKSEGRINLSEFLTENQTADDLTLAENDTIDVYVEKIEGHDGQLVLSYNKALGEIAWKKLEQIAKESEDQIVEGTILCRVKGGFVVNVCDVNAFLPGSQVDVKPMKDHAHLIGVKQPFKIMKMDSRQGNVVVSRRAIIEKQRSKQREEMLSNIKEGQIFLGKVKNVTNYGAFIDLGCADGLLHVTDMSWKRVNHPTEDLTVGQDIDVQVIKYNKDNKRISLGVKQMTPNPWENMNEKYLVKQKYEGIVTSVLDYGVFVRLEPEVEGLIHVSEISWTKSNCHPKKLYKVNDKVEVMVLDVDVSKHRISLGVKQCTENPWTKFAEKHKVNDVIEGIVRNTADFGVFVGIDGNTDGIDGLIHLSDISWESEDPKLLQDYKEGDSVQAKILGIDAVKQRISLGIKQLTEDPLEKLFNSLSHGDTVTCSVSEVFNDGLKVFVKEKISCFIKKSELAISKIDQRADRFAPGDRVDAKIVKLDREKRMLSVSIKELEEANNNEAVKAFGSADSGASLANILGDAMSKSNFHDN